jgi:hypothetical protein
MKTRSCASAVKAAAINWLCWGRFPLLFFLCENLEPEQLKWLLDHGADPNRGEPGKDFATYSETRFRRKM